MTRTRILLAAILLAVLGGATLLDRASSRCMEYGGHFEALRWTCVPHPAIHIERDLQRS